MGAIEQIGTINGFQRREYEALYWKIEGFSTLSERANVNYYYISPPYNFKGLRNCWLRFYPSGTNGKSGIIGFSFVSSSHKEADPYVYLTLGLKTQSGRIEKCFSNYFFPQPQESSAPAFIRQSDFLKRKEELVLSDCLTFVVFLSPDVLNITRDVEDQTETRHTKEDGDEEKKGGEKVLQDIATLLASGDKSDATIFVEESEYKVHSCILSARTPVFAALFEHDTLEKATRKITISDCEPAVFKEFLNYIYSGSVQNLTVENSPGLYRVADKYLVKELKEASRQSIRDNLCPETFCEAVQLALMCKDEALLESAIEYFEINFRHVIRSVEWQRYIEENPREANEILIRSFGPP